MSTETRAEVRLTLPGTTPGLLRRCSPVLDVDDQDRPGIVTFVPADLVMSERPRISVAVGGEVRNASHPDHYALDLTDATGRLHAAWWLADRLFAEDGPYLSASVMPGQRILGPVEFGLSSLSLEGERWRVLPWKPTQHLDPLDPRTLPDGSRWVDAEALRLVCLHVAGLA